MMFFDVKELITDLQSINAKSAQHAALPTKLARLKADLDAKTQRLDRLNAELTVAEAKLAELQAKNQQEHKTEVDAKMAELRAVEIKVYEAGLKQAQLDVAIRDKRALHDNIVGAMTVLLARLEGKPEEGLIARMGSGEFHT